MIKKDCPKCKIGLLACFLLLFVLSGCAYQAKLFDRRHLEPGATAAVKCNVVKKPVIKVSEMGDFVFWAGGPGPMTWCIAQVINESNNSKYRKMLKPALETDLFCEDFQACLEEAVEKIGLQVRRITIEDEDTIKTITSNIRQCNIFESSPQNNPHKYLLHLKISCGLFKSEAKPVAQIEGRLLRLDDKKLLWKNKLSFEGPAAAEHKPFGDGKEAVEIWEKDCVELQNCLLEALAGATDLLAREFADTTTSTPAEQQQLTKFKLRDGSSMKANIIDQSPQRIVVRLEGGSVRSIPAENFVVAFNP